MTTRFTAVSAKIFAATLGLLVAGGAVAEASAATVTKTRTVATTRATKPIFAKRSVKIVHRIHRPHLAVRMVPGHRLAPRIKVAHAAITRHVISRTVIR